MRTNDWLGDLKSYIAIQSTFQTQESISNSSFLALFVFQQITNNGPKTNCKQKLQPKMSKYVKCLCESEVLINTNPWFLEPMVFRAHNTYMDIKRQA